MKTQETQKSKSIVECYQLYSDVNEIIIAVTNPTQIKETLTKHTVYTIQGSDLLGSFNIVRRYRDFDSVRTSMADHWPGCYVPPVPRKKIVGNNQFLFIQSRRIGLQQFCQQVSHLKHLWYGKQFQSLIRGSTDLLKSLKEFQNQTAESIAQKYEQNLKNLQGRDYEAKLIEQVSGFQQYVKKIGQIITSYRQMAKSLNDYYLANSQQYSILLSYILPQFQKNFLSVYVNNITDQKYILANPSDQKLIQLLSQYKKTIEQKQFEKLYLLLQKQQRQIQAFSQTFRIRRHYDNELKRLQLKDKQLHLQQSKLQSGNFISQLERYFINFISSGKQSVFKSIMKSNIQDEKTKKSNSIEANSKKIKAYTILNELITIIMAGFQIPRFKKLKVQKYFQTIRIMSQFQMKVQSIKSQICKHVLLNSNLLHVDLDQF